MSSQDEMETSFCQDESQVHTQTDSDQWLHESFAGTVQKPKRKCMRPRSEVWDHFSKFTTPRGENKAKCNYCSSELCADTARNGTSGLRNHMLHCKKKPTAQDAQSQNFSVDDEAEGLDSWKFDQETIRKGLAEMLISGELPLTLVENKSFRKFMEIVQPKFKVPSRLATFRDSFRIYFDEKARFKEYLQVKKQRVCLTTDTWTSVERMSYMCLTAHFIDDDWKFNKRILNFFPFSSHKGRDIGVEIEKCLKDWGIQRVFTITLDNASSNEVVMSYMHEVINSWGFGVLQCKYLHMRCVAHIINLIARDGLELIGKSVMKVREVVRYVRQSTSRMNKFKECCGTEKIECKQLLYLDVATRWTSTYVMLETAQKFEKAFNRYDYENPYFRMELESGGSGVPDKSDWENVRRMISYLKHFYELTLQVSGSKYMTSNFIFHEIYVMRRLLDAWSKSNDFVLATMVGKMKLTYDKYWGDPMKLNYMIYLSVILDPRYKFDWLHFALKKMYGESIADVLGVRIKEVLNSLYEEYEESRLPNEQVDSATIVDMEIDDPTKRVLKLIEIERRQFFSERLGGKTSRTDIDRYLSEEIEVNKTDFDILIWWKVNGPRFPTLAKVARDVLAVPVFSVASESAFSTEGRSLDAFKSSLPPNVVQSLICVQDWLEDSNSIESLLQEDDVVQLEKELQKISQEPLVDLI